MSDYIIDRNNDSNRYEVSNNQYSNYWLITKVIIYWYMC